LSRNQGGSQAGGRALLFVPNNCLGPIDEPDM